MNVTFTANNAKELKTKMMDFFSEFNVPTVESSGQLAMTFPENTTVAQAEPAPAKTEKKGRKAKAEKPSVAELAAEAAEVGIQEDSEEITTVAPVPAVTTKEMALDALKKVHEVKGLDAARDILKGFQASRVSDLDSKKYADFVSRCQAELLT